MMMVMMMMMVLVMMMHFDFCLPYHQQLISLPRSTTFQGFTFTSWLVGSLCDEEAQAIDGG